MSKSSQYNILKHILLTLKYSPNPILIDSNISWYGQEIHNLIEILSTHLNKLGIKKGDIVAIILENSVEYLVSVLSVWSCYATILPLNPLNHEVEISNFLTDANVSFVLYNNSSKTLIDKTKNILNRNQKCKEFLSDNKWLDVTINHAQKFFTNNTLNPSFSLSQISKLEENIPDFNKDDPMVLAYTSGTTGKSKAVIHSHENILTNASFIAKNWYGGLFGQKLLARNIEYQRILAVLPLTHNFGFNVTFLSALLHGGTILLMKRFSAVEVLRYAQDNKATVMPLVPTMFSAIFNNSERSRVSLSSMRLLISGGSAMPKTLRDLFQTAYPLATVIDTYGLSEASLVSCTPIDRTHPSGTIGYPIADTEISVRNDFGKIITDFSVGEFWIRGKSVISHYFKEESRNSFEKEGWFKTGDLGYLTKEGYFVLVDRKKDIIIHGGYNIYPLEIESVLYEHYAIDLCVVFGIPDFRFGEKVVACVVLKEHYLNTTSNDIIFHCKKYLASYKIPSFIAFRKELAKNHTGKILRRLVKEAFLSDLHDNSPSIGSK